MQKNRRDSGFTLIEIILSLAIIALVIPIASNMMIQSFDVFNSGIYRMNTGQRVELALEEIANYLRSAKTKPEEDITATLKTYNFIGYNNSGNEFNIQIKLEGNANDHNLLLNGRIIAENVTAYFIEPIGIDSNIFEVNIEYRVRENESDASVLRNKSIEVYPKNLS